MAQLKIIAGGRFESRSFLNEAVYIVTRFVACLATWYYLNRLL